MSNQWPHRNNTHSVLLTLPPTPPPHRYQSSLLLLTASSIGPVTRHTVTYTATDTHFALLTLQPMVHCATSPLLLEGHLRVKPVDEVNTDTPTTGLPPRSLTRSCSPTLHQTCEVRTERRDL